MVALGENEQMIWQGRPAWSNYMGHVIFALIFLVIGVPFLFRPEVAFGGALFSIGALGFLAAAGINRLGNLFIVTSQRAIVERGLISRHVSEVELANVRDIQLHQSVPQRLLGTGRLELSSAGRGSAEVVFNGIAKPDLVKELVRKGMREKSGQP